MARLDAKTKRQILSGSMLGAGVVLAVVLFLIVNYFGWKYHTRYDWTSSNLYSLSEKTENVLAGLDRDVEIIVFMSPIESLYGPVSELLSSYEGASNRVSVRHVDPEKNLLEAQALVDRFELTQLNVLVFDAGDDRRVVDISDLADYDYSGMQYGQGAEMTGFKGEQVFTSTLVELMENRKPKILFTTGHGELGLDDFSPRGLSMARDLLGKDNFELEDWLSLGESAVPEGTDLIVIAGPTSTFVEPELELLRSYLEAAGRLLVLLDPNMSPAGGLVETGLELLLSDFGVEVGEDIVVDPGNPLPFFGAETIFVNVYGSHVITRPLDQAQLPVIVPMARSVRAAADTEGLQVTELMLTSIEGWGEGDLEHLDQVAKDDSDLQGPVSIAVAVAAAEDDGDAAGVEDGSGEPAIDEAPVAGLRLVVVGDSDFVSNSQLQQVPNATFFGNTLNWLVERETLVGIPPKQPEQTRLSLTQSELSRLSWLVLLGLPGLAIGLGVAVYLQRRR